MKSLTKILLLIILVSCDQEKQISPIFYEVTSEKGKVFILGSIHSSDGSIFPLPNYIIERFNESNQFFMEIKPLQNDTLFQETIHDDLNYRLKEHISKETYMLVEDISNDLIIPQNILVSLRPSEIISLVEEHELQKVGISNKKGIESYLYYLANEQNMKVDGFESYAEILEKVEQVDTTETEEKLKDYLKNRKRITQETRELLELWKVGNEKGLMEKIKWFSNKYPTFTEIILLERNKKIIKKIEGLLSGKDITFVSIGLGHLIGEGNIIKILSEKGYNVELVKKAT